MCALCIQDRRRTLLLEREPLYDARRLSGGFLPRTRLVRILTSLRVQPKRRQGSLRAVGSGGGRRRTNAMGRPEESRVRRPRAPRRREARALAAVVLPRLREGARTRGAPVAWSWLGGVELIIGRQRGHAAGAGPEDFRRGRLCLSLSVEMRACHHCPCREKESRVQWSGARASSLALLLRPRNRPSVSAGEKVYASEM